MTPILQPTPALLKEIKMMQCFSEMELSQIISTGSMQNHQAHANIVVESEQSWGLYLILEGLVGVFKTNRFTGDVYDIAQLGGGSFFGEMSLIEESARSASVRAMTDCQLFYISKDSFMRFLNQSSDMKLRFYENCVKLMSHRLREIGDNYVVSQYQLWKIALKKEAA